MIVVTPYLTIGDDEISFRVEAREFIENHVGAVEPYGLNFGDGLANPFGAALLAVAIGERDPVALLAEPCGQMNRHGRFSDAPFGIGNHDDHPSQIA